MTDKIYDVPAAWAKRAFVDEAKYQDDVRALDQGPERLLGASRPSASTGSSRSPRSRTPPSTRTTSRSNGSRTARSTSPTTASTGIWPSAATRPRSSGKATTPRTTRRSPIKQLHAEVCRFANVLKARGVKKGDRVTIYMPMIPEAAISMLACARIGAVHSVVFGGFSPDSLAGRIEDCKSTIIVTADEGVRGGRKIPLKANADAAADKAGGVTIDHRRAPHRRKGEHEGRAATSITTRSRRSCRPIARARR